MDFIKLQAKKPRYYPAEDVPAKTVPRKQNPPKTRASLTPGTIVILLAGHFRGRRVVVLKSLTSGLLLVTGPYQINGVPLKRVNQSYVIATSTKVDVSGVDVSKFDDAYFAKGPSEGKDAFLKPESDSKAAVVSDDRKTDQKSLDEALVKAIEGSGEPLLKDYLHARFTLTKNDRPHKMLF